VRAVDGQISEVIDIRQPVFIEMEYDVLTPGHTLVPNCHFYTEDGTCVFIVHDWLSPWRRQSREPGRYRSTVKVPGNFLSEGSLIVSAAVSAYEPLTVHFHERDAVAFQIVDSLDGDSARGDYAGPLPGVVRPILDWKTDYEPTEVEQIETVRIR
jgi:lipopolysaccharide transport system ATP-binding protein